MQILNGVKVISRDEQVKGLVIQQADDPFTFKMVEYDVNEYGTYDNKEVGSFSIYPVIYTKEEIWGKFMDELNGFSEPVYVEEVVVNFLNC